MMSEFDGSYAVTAMSPLVWVWARSMNPTCSMDVGLNDAQPRVNGIESASAIAAAFM